MSRWFGNRELSWLDFNERVLSLARETSIPLLERIKFCAIFSGNLDEFFQVRVAALKGQVAAGVPSSAADGLSPTRQLAAVGQRVESLVKEQERILLHDLLPQLVDQGITVCRWHELTADEQSELSQFFDRQLFPVLTPLAVDPAHPFPYISNLALSLGVLVRDPSSGEQRFARVKVPTFLKRFHQVSENRFVPIEDVMSANIADLFLGMDIVHVSAFRVTRNADLTLEDEDADDLLQRRVAFFNVWKPLYRRVEELPLAMCDASTHEPDDMLRMDLKYRERTGEIYVMRYSPKHRWMYFPFMEPNHALILKTFDSEVDGRCRFMGHSAFEHPDTATDAQKRESIEVRTMAFF